MGREFAYPPQDPRPARILIADDHPLFRAALAQTLHGSPGLEVVGEAEDGEDAVGLCRRLRPDLVLVDVRMPRMDGLEATRAIRREFPGIIVLVMTALEEPGYLAEAVRAGAAGYVLKTASGPQIVDAIRRVLDGEYALPQGVATQLLRRLLGNEAPKEEEERPAKRRQEEEGSHPLLETLTPKEREVLRLLVRGRSNREIARNLLVSTSTVKKHVHQIISKLGVSDRTQAVIKAIELGLISGPHQ